MTFGWPEAVGVAIVASLNLYVISGGADFGAGVLVLLARGEGRAEQREAAQTAIAPIWEANHVWLIAVIVLLFTAFPSAFAVLSTALHIPLTIMLMGIVLRGSAFVFRSYGPLSEASAHRWGTVFGVASTVTPVMLGVTLATAASGRIRLDPGTGTISSGFFGPWMTPFSWVVGILVLALFVQLAAIYLCVELEGSDLVDEFRTRGLWAGVGFGILSAAVLVTSRGGAPHLFEGLFGRPWAPWLQILTAVGWVGCLAALRSRRFTTARALAVVQATLVVWVWSGLQYPYLVVPDVTLRGAAAEDSVLRPLLIALAAGAAILLPAFIYLFGVFKGGMGETPSSR